jgi:hypothetical protein
MIEGDKFVVLISIGLALGLSIAALIVVIMK